MKTVMQAAIYLFLAISLFILMTACSPKAEMGEPPPDAVCSAIVNTKCVRCHYKTRICDTLGTKSISQWKRSIKFMIKQGAELTEDEENKVIACLSALPPGSAVVCE